MSFDAHLEMLLNSMDKKDEFQERFPDSENLEFHQETSGESKKQVFVKYKSTFPVDVTDELTVEEIKKHVYEKEGVPGCVQLLRAKGKTLSQDALGQLKEGDNIHVHVKGRGGTKHTVTTAKHHDSARIPNLEVRFLQQDKPRDKCLLRTSKHGNAICLHVVIPSTSIGVDSNFVISDTCEVRLKNRKDVPTAPYLLSVLFYDFQEGSDSTTKRQTTDVIKCHCFVKNEMVHVDMLHCKVNDIPFLHLSADELTVAKTVSSSGCISFEASHFVRIQSRLMCQKLTVVSQPGRISIPTEGLVQTDVLQLSASLTSIEGRVYSHSQSLLCREQKHIENTEATGSDKIMRISVDGELLVGTDGCLGMRGCFGTCGRAVVNELEMTVTGDIHNYGHIAAKQQIQLSCHNILSGRHCKEETVQRYFSIIEKEHAFDSKYQGDVPTQANLHEAVETGQAALVATLLKQGLDPNSPCPKTGKLALDVAQAKVAQLSRERNKGNKLQDKEVRKFDAIVSLLQAWGQRSGSIRASMVICQVTGNIDDCSQIIGEHVKILVGGDLTVEADSVWTSGSIWGRCSGSLIVEGTIKLNTIECLTIAKTFKIEESGKVIVGGEGNVIVEGQFYNKGAFLNGKGQINLSTKVMKQGARGVFGSLNQIVLTLRADSNDIRGVIKGKSICFIIAAYIVIDSEIFAEDTCVFKLDLREDVEKCGKIMLTNCLKVSNGPLEVEKARTELDYESIVDVKIAGKIEAHGILASTVLVKLLPKSEAYIRPIRSTTNADIPQVIVSFGSLITENNAKVHTISEKANTDIVFTCSRLLRHDGILLADKESNFKTKARVQVFNFINHGMLENFDTIHIIVLGLFQNFKQISVSESVFISGEEGTIVNESSETFLCREGSFKVNEIRKLCNGSGALIKANTISIGVLPLVERFDFKNSGEVVSKNDIIVNASNITNKGGVIESKNSYVQLTWTSNLYDTTKIEGTVVAQKHVVLIAKRSKSFLCKCVGGRRSQPDCRTHCMDFVLPEDGVLISCPEGTVVIDTAIHGKSVLVIEAQKGCSIIQCVDVNSLELRQLSTAFRNRNEVLHDTYGIPGKGEHITDLQTISDVYNAFTELEFPFSPMKEHAVFLLKLSRPTVLSVSELTALSEEPLSTIKLVASRQSKIIFRDSISVDNRLIIQGQIEMSTHCSVTAYSLVFSSDCNCAIVSSKTERHVKMTNDLRVATNKGLYIAGRIQEMNEIDHFLIIDCAEGIIISGLLKIRGHLQLKATQNISCVDRASITCKSFSCGTSADTNASRPALTLQHASLEVLGSFQCMLDTISLNSDANLLVSSNCSKSSAHINVSSTACLSGTMTFRLQGSVIINALGVLKLENLQSEIISPKVVLQSAKSVCIDKNVILEIQCPAFWIVSKHHSDVEEHGIINLSGKIKGKEAPSQMHNETEGTVSQSNVVVKGRQVDIAQTDIERLDRFEVDMSESVTCNSCCIQAAKEVRFIGENNIFINHTQFSYVNVRCPHLVLTAANIVLTGKMETLGTLWIDNAKQVTVIDRGDIFCVSLHCKPSKQAQTSSLGDVVIKSGRLTVQGSCHFDIHSLSLDCDGEMIVSSDTNDAQAYVNAKETVQLSGRFVCSPGKCFQIQCNELLTRTDFDATINTDACIIRAKRLINIDYTSKINVKRGQLTLTNAFEGDDEMDPESSVSLSGNITGQIPYDQTDNASNVSLPICQLEVEGSNIHLAQLQVKKFQVVELITPLALTWEETCTLTTGGTLSIDAQTFDFQGQIRQHDCIDVSSWNMLLNGSIDESKEIKIVAELVVVNTGGISCQRTALVSPIYLNCPSENGQCVTCPEVPHLGNENQEQLIVEGLLCVIIGSHLQSKNIQVKSPLHFEFASKKTNILTKQDLKNWKEVVDSSLSKLSVADGNKSEVEKLVQEALKIPQVVCHLSVASNLCGDIITFMKRIKQNGLDAFNQNELICCLQKAHTQYTRISLLNLDMGDKIIAKVRKGKERAKAVGRKLLETILPDSFSANQDFKIADDTQVGITTHAVIFQGQATHVASEGNFTALSLDLGGQSTWMNEGQIESCGDIIVSATLIQQKRKEGRLMRAVQGCIDLQAKEMYIEGIKSKQFKAKASGSAHIQSAEIGGDAKIKGEGHVVVEDMVAQNIDVDVGVKATVQSTKIQNDAKIKSGHEVSIMDTISGNLEVSSEGNTSLLAATIEHNADITSTEGDVCISNMKAHRLDIDAGKTATIQATQVDEDASIKSVEDVLVKDTQVRNLNIDVEQTASVQSTTAENDASIDAGGEVLVKDTNVQNLNVDAGNTATVQSVMVQGDAAIESKGDAVVEDIMSCDLDVKATKQVRMGHVDVGENLRAESKDGNVQLDANVKARKALFEAPGGKVNLCGTSGTAAHTFGTLSIEAKQVKDVVQLLRASGAYEDMKISDQLDLAVSEQSIILANIGKKDFGFSVQAKQIDVDSNLESSQSIYLESRERLTMKKGASVKAAQNSSLIAGSDLNVEEGSSITADDVRIASKTGSVDIVGATIDGSTKVSMNARKNINIRAKVRTNGPAKKSIIKAGKGRAEANDPAISFKSGGDTNIMASDLLSQGLNDIDAEGSINFTTTTYDTESTCTNTMWFGFRTETTTEVTTNVQRSNISGHTNKFNAGKKFTSEGALLSSELGNTIHAKEKVSMIDKVTTTTVRKKDCVLGGMLYNKESHRTSLTSHGTCLQDNNASATSSITSENSNIESTGFSVKTPGSYIEKAKKVGHSRRMLCHEENVTEFGFSVEKGTTANLGYRSGFKTCTSTCDSSMNIGGTYTVHAEEMLVKKAYGITVGKDMICNTKRVTFEGAELETREGNSYAHVTATPKSGGLTMGSSQKQGVKQQTQKLNVVGKLQFNNTDNVRLENCSAEVASLQGEIRNMEVITKADIESCSEVNVGVEVDYLTRTPALDVNCGAARSEKVTQQSAIRVHSDSKGLSVQTLSLTGSAMHFDGDVHKFAKHIVSKEVHELETNFNLGLSIKKPTASHVGSMSLDLQVDYSKGTFQSCISSKTGNMDTSIKQRVNTNPDACRKVQKTFSLHLNQISSPKQALTRAVKTSLLPTCMETLQTQFNIPSNITQTLTTIANGEVDFEKAVQLLASETAKAVLPKEFIDASETLIRKADPTQLILWVCKFFSIDCELVPVIIPVLSGSSNPKDLLMAVVQCGAKYVYLPDEISFVIFEIIESEGGLLTSERGKTSILAVGDLIGIPTGVTELLLEFFTTRRLDKIGLLIVKIIWSNLGLPNEAFDGLSIAIHTGDIKPITIWLCKSLGISTTYITLVCEAINSSNVRETVTDLIKNHGKLLCMPEEYLDAVRALLMNNDYERITMCLSRKWNVAPELLAEAFQILLNCERFAMGLREVPLCFARYFGLSSSDVTLLQSFLNNDSKETNVLPVLLNVAQNVFKSTVGEQIFKSMLLFLETADWYDRALHLLRILATHYQVPESCVDGFVELAKTQNPTKLATWFADCVGINREITIAMAKALLNKQSPISIITTVAKVAEFPPLAINLLEQILTKTMNEICSSSHLKGDAKIDAKTFTHLAETCLLPDCMEIIKTQFNIPSTVIQTLTDFAIGEVAFGKAVKQLASATVKAVLPKELTDASEILISKGDPTPLILWVCKYFEFDCRYIDTITTVLSGSSNPKDILVAMAKCGAMYVSLPDKSAMAIVHIIESEVDLLTSECDKASLLTVGNLIGIPAGVSELLLEFCTSRRLDTIGLSIVKIIWSNVGLPNEAFQGLSMAIRNNDMKPILTWLCDFLGINEKYITLVSEAFSSSNVHESITELITDNGKLLGMPDEFLNSVRSLFVDKVYEPITTLLSQKWNIAPDLLNETLQTLFKCENFDMGLRKLPLCFARYVGLSATDETLLESFLDNDGQYNTFLPLLVSVAEKLFKQKINKEVYKSMLLILSSDSWFERATLLLRTLATHYEVPGECFDGCLALIEMQDPTKLATWFADRYHIKAEVIMAITNALMKRQNPLQIIKTIAKAVEIPDVAINLLEDMMEQQLSKFPSPSQLKDVAKSLLETFKHPTETFNLPLNAKEAFTDIADGKSIFKTFVQVFVSQTGKTLLPKELVDAVESVVAQGDLKPCISWICKVMDVSTDVGPFIETMFSRSIQSKELVMEVVKCGAKHIHFPEEKLRTVEYILKCKANILRTPQGRKTFLAYGDLIGIPSCITDLLLAYSRSTRLECVGVMLVEVIGTHLEVPKEILVGIKSVILKQDTKELALWLCHTLGVNAKHRQRVLISVKSHNLRDAVRDLIADNNQTLGISQDCIDAIRALDGNDYVPLARWATAKFKVKSELCTLVVRKLYKSKSLIEGIKELSCCFAKITGLSSTDVAILQAIFRGDIKEGSFYTLLIALAKKMLSSEIEEDFLESMMHVIKADDWFERAMYILQPLATYYSVPDADSFVKGVLDLIKSRNPSKIAVWFSHRTKVEQDICLAIANGLLNYKDPMVLVTQLATTMRIPKEAINILDKIVKQNMTDGISLFSSKNTPGLETLKSPADK